MVCYSNPELCADVIVSLDVLPVWTSGQNAFSECSRTDFLCPLVHARCSSVSRRFALREGTSCNCVFTRWMITQDPTAWTEEVFAKQRGSDAVVPKTSTRPCIPRIPQSRVSDSPPPLCCNHESENAAQTRFTTSVSLTALSVAHLSVSFPPFISLSPTLALRPLFV